MQTKILDNIIWNAAKENPCLVKSGEGAVVFEPEVSPFAGMPGYTSDDFRNLTELAAQGQEVLIFTPHRLDFPFSWEFVFEGEMHQMVATESVSENREEKVVLQPLTIENVPQMLALTELTKPGPFLPGTIRFGKYLGIFHEARLVAMAGLRLCAGSFMEISAVCTHPDFTGKGLGKALLLGMMEHIAELGKTPFLHVRKDNTSAIRLYKQLGFEVRKDFYYTMIRKK
ncbi:GNAT family N-acetyltransferase [Jiulongibacter sediminis]|uniref:N-acetyltransferase domain-containing protein n=1 Tax=Jiulongibacter sediminis TaxID=1605367 RepID=A0A0P7BX85_9BACT|nr:GNAT family N-acetyltransferase [Jiulongibacter sediminis]KPM46714.1 hypothetical protein AFM12_18230 [Jiulongibacter sediminis]TBX21619.1 hypothetical protein TK44_18235 [Jiulongibacter sediminis]